MLDWDNELDLDNVFSESSSEPGLSSKDFSICDLKEIANIYAAEYNNEEFHDRVLVLDIVKDGSIGNSTTTACLEPCREMTLGGKKETSQSMQSQAKVPNQDGQIVALPGLTNIAERKRMLSDENEPSISHKRQEDDVAVGIECEVIKPDTRHPGDAQDEKNEKSSKTFQTATIYNSKVLRQQKMFVHSVLLAVHSTYFRSLFYSGMKETREKEVHIQATESEEKGHLQLLQAVYEPNILNEATVDELLLVLELAEKYSVTYVFRKCKYLLQAMRLSLDICEKIMHVIQVKQSVSDVADLVRNVTLFLAKVFSPLDKTWKTKSFENQSETLLKDLLSTDEIATRSENTIFHALMHWIKINGYPFESQAESNSNASTLLSLVHFERLTIDYLYNIVQHHPVATKMAGFMDLYLRGISYHALTDELKNRLTRKPAKPRKTVKNMVDYQWFLEKEKLDTLPNGVEIFSEHFWWCGYEMKMNLKKPSSASQGKVELTLEALSLTCESEFSVKWKCSYAGSSHSYCKCDRFFKTHPRSTNSIDFPRLYCTSGTSVSYYMPLELKIDPL